MSKTGTACMLIDGKYSHEKNIYSCAGIIEKDESNGWAPEILAKKIVKIVACKKPRQKYIIGSFENKLAVVLKYILPGSLFRKILEDHYGIK